MSKTERHRRVIPKDVLRDIMIDKELARHLSHARVYCDFASQSVRQVRYNDAYAGVRFADLEPHRSGTKDWFFDKKDSTILRATRQKMLWTLKHKVPTQMRKANEIGRLVTIE